MPPKPVNTPQLTSAEISRLLELQEAEVKIRSQELSLRGKEIDVNAKSAEKSIEAQLEVEKLKHQAFISFTTTKSYLIGFGMFCLAAVIVAALISNHDTVALEIIQQAAIVFGSFFGGFAVGRIKKDNQE